MLKQGSLFIFLWLAVFSAQAEANRLSLTTLNCGAFFGGGETRIELGQPRTSPEYWTKARNLVDLWPTNAPLLAQPPGLHDAFVLTGENARTHANGKAYDRILISSALAQGDAGIKFETISVQPHKHGKGEEKKLFTDHFPVTATFALVPKK